MFNGNRAYLDIDQVRYEESVIFSLVSAAVLCAGNYCRGRHGAEKFKAYYKEQFVDLAK